MHHTRGRRTPARGRCSHRLGRSRHLRLRKLLNRKYIFLSFFGRVCDFAEVSLTTVETMAGGCEITYFSIKKELSSMR